MIAVIPGDRRGQTGRLAPFAAIRAAEVTANIVFTMVTFKGSMRLPK